MTLRAVVGSRCAGLSVIGESSPEPAVYKSDNRQPRAAVTGKARRALVALVLIMVAPTMFACPVCFGAPNDPMVKGVNNGIWVLLALVGVVQLGFIAMFWSFWRRAREQKRFRDSLRVIHTFDREGPFS